tara:strand:+ start:67 stop:195 length:129 start_codon:yes stop_codon:yes gene_type:complete
MRAKSEAKGFFKGFASMISPKHSFPTSRRKEISRESDYHGMT